MTSLVVFEPFSILLSENPELVRLVVLAVDDYKTYGSLILSNSAILKSLVPGDKERQKNRFVEVVDRPTKREKYERLTTTGEFHGFYIAYHYRKANFPMICSTYKNGKLHGLQREFDTSGNLIKKYYCVNGRIEGTYEELIEFGHGEGNIAIKRCEEYVDGKSQRFWYTNDIFIIDDENVNAL